MSDQRLLLMLFRDKLIFLFRLRYPQLSHVVISNLCFMYSVCLISYSLSLSSCFSLDCVLFPGWAPLSGSREWGLLKHNPMHRLCLRDVMVHQWVVDNSTEKPSSRTAPNNWRPKIWTCFHVNNNKQISLGTCFKNVFLFGE